MLVSLRNVSLAGQARPKAEGKKFGRPAVLTDEELLFHLLSKLYEQASVVITTNLSFSEWAGVARGEYARDEDGDGSVRGVHQRRATLLYLRLLLKPKFCGSIVAVSTVMGLNVESGAKPSLVSIAIRFPLVASVERLSLLLLT
jgi:hypothetical protein